VNRRVLADALVDRRIRLFCAIWGMTFFLGGIFSPLFVRPTWELPLSIPTNAVETDDGTLYCGSMFYNRIQAYDRSGRFIRGWSASASGEFFLEAQSPRRIVAYSARSGMISVLDPTRGESTLEPPRNEIGYYTLRSRLLDIPNDDSRARLIVHDGLIGPAWIQRIRADGTAEEIVRRRWTLYPIQAPFPAWALLFVSGLPGAIPALRRRLRKICRSA
jgi:hypothetical protein